MLYLVVIRCHYNLNTCSFLYSIDNGFGTQTSGEAMALWLSGAGQLVQNLV